MITKIKKSESYPSFDYIGREDMITPRQQRRLTDLIYQNIQGEDDRERWFSNISDITSEEAEELILEFSMSWCR